MKKIIIAAAALLISATSFAQLGITGGLTSCSSNFKAVADEIKSKSINQFHVGILYKVPVGKYFVVQPEVIYNVKGTKLEDIFNISSADLKTGYIEVPIQVQGGVSLGKVARIYAIAEPFVGYALSNVIDKNDVITKNEWNNVKNRLEVGLGLGAGIELFSHIQVGAKYFWNFGGIYDLGEKFGNATCGGLAVSVAVTL